MSGHDENVEVMASPNWQPAKLVDLIQAIGLNPQGYAEQFAALQAQIDSTRADMQRQIDDLRSGGTQPAAQQHGGGTHRR